MAWLYTVRKRYANDAQYTTGYLVYVSDICGLGCQVAYYGHSKGLDALN
jgi:hypothetical protein